MIQNDMNLTYLNTSINGTNAVDLGEITCMNNIQKRHITQIVKKEYNSTRANKEMDIHI